MKKILLSAACSILAVGGLLAQPTAYDAAKISSNDLNGTARFVGMGGAMGALGSDISTISTNPAGSALFRRADIMLTAGFDQVSVNAGGQKDNRTSGRLNNIGVVMPFHYYGEYGSLVSMSFGFQYQHRNNFHKNMYLSQVLDAGVSQLGQATDMAQGTRYDDILGTNSYNPFYNGQVGWLPLMGVNNGMIFPDGSNTNYDFVRFPGGSNSLFESTERGGINQGDMNLSLNFSNRFYVGATLGFYNVDYTKNTYYTEWIQEPPFGQLGYDIYSNNWLHGDGVDFKLGAIVRPFEESSFRLGAAIHTPTLYRLTWTTGFDAAAAYLEQNPNTGNYEREELYLTSYDNLDGNGQMDHDFRLNTPWLFNLSAGITIGTHTALGMEYEYEDHSSSSIKDVDGRSYPFNNSQINQQLKGTHTLRMGGEFKLMPELAFRLGYNYTSAAYNRDSCKEHAYNSINTDTDFANRQAAHIFTTGVGLRLTPNAYFDIAYKYSSQDADFYAFDGSPRMGTPALTPTSLSERTHSFMATIGYRF